MPAWPAGIAKVTWGGRLARGDIWTMSVFVEAPSSDIWYVAADGSETIRTAMGEAVGSWFRSDDALISKAARLTWMKANLIGTDGKYSRPYTNEWELNPGLEGWAGANNNTQWQHLSLAVTHRAREARGPATRGRTFPPAVAVFPTPTGVPDTATLQRYVNRYAQMLFDLQQAIPGDTAGRPLIVSSGTKAAPNTGTARPIAVVEVGNMIDVQQRRRNADPEEYVRSTVNFSGGAGAGAQPIG